MREWGRSREREEDQRVEADDNFGLSRSRTGRLDRGGVSSESRLKHERVKGADGEKRCSWGPSASEKKDLKTRSTEDARDETIHWMGVNRGRAVKHELRRAVRRCFRASASSPDHPVIRSRARIGFYFRADRISSTGSSLLPR